MSAIKPFRDATGSDAVSLSVTVPKARSRALEHFSLNVHDNVGDIVYFKLFLIDHWFHSVDYYNLT